MRDRGVVVVATDPFGHTPRRPYLIISGLNHPFAGNQYIALGVTTKNYTENLSLDGAFKTGTLDRKSFVSPWAVVSLTEADIDRAVARLTDEFTTTSAKELTQYVLETD